MKPFNRGREQRGEYQRRDFSEIKCYKCGEAGHIARFCKSEKIVDKSGGQVKSITRKKRQVKYMKNVQRRHLL